MGNLTLSKTLSALHVRGQDIMLVSVVVVGSLKNSVAC